MRFCRNTMFEICVVSRDATFEQMDYNKFCPNNVNNFEMHDHEMNQ